MNNTRFHAAHAIAGLFFLVTPVTSNANPLADSRALAQIERDTLACKFPDDCDHLLFEIAQLGTPEAIAALSRLAQDAPLETTRRSALSSLVIAQRPSDQGSESDVAYLEAILRRTDSSRDKLGLQGRTNMPTRRGR